MYSCPRSLGEKGLDAFGASTCVGSIDGLARAAARAAPSSRLRARPWRGARTAALPRPPHVWEQDEESCQGRGGCGDRRRPDPTRHHGTVWQQLALIPGRGAAPGNILFRLADIDGFALFAPLHRRDPCAPFAHALLRGPRRLGRADRAHARGGARGGRAARQRERNQRELHGARQAAPRERAHERPAQGQLPHQRRHR